ncbi:conserved hypothetical protein [Luteimonas sp. 9C]|uniref:hypothetical protein n=1 Tax=Luteimonas sp. 9C TaxID=2653148 RepID=UPI0012F2E581|nr:hypothetical protein [Luteimonas sp. 9C]VXB53586.1 conserved hypothetical protein [Luteimonas sp. 9C]
MSSNTPKSATAPDQAQQADHVAVNDRKAARGDAYADDNNRSAEGNDAALISGPAFVRRVHADGTVEAVAPDAEKTPDADAERPADHDAPATK